MSITPKRPIFQNDSYAAGESWVRMLIQTVKTCTDMSIFMYLWKGYLQVSTFYIIWVIACIWVADGDTMV